MSTRKGNLGRRARQLQHEHGINYTAALRMAEAEAAGGAPPGSGGSGGRPAGGASSGRWPISAISAAVDTYIVDHAQYTDLDVDLVDDRPRGLRIQGWDLPAQFAASRLEDLQLEEEASAVWTRAASTAMPPATSEAAAVGRTEIVGTYRVAGVAVVEGFPDKSSWDLPDIDHRIQVSDTDHNRHMMRAEAWVPVVATFDIGVDELGRPVVRDMQLAIPQTPTPAAGGTGGTGGTGAGGADGSGRSGVPSGQEGRGRPGRFNSAEAARETVIWHAQRLDGNDLPSPAAASLLERHGIAPAGLEVMVTGVVVDATSAQVDLVERYTGADLYELDVRATVTTSVYLPPAVADQVLQQAGVRLDFREDPDGVQVLLPPAEVLVEGTALATSDDITDGERTSVSLVDAP